MFQHMMKFGIEYYGGPLPFDPQITRLLYRLGIDLRPQHVLERVDALVGPRKPVTGSGGVNSQQQLASSALDNAAAATYKQEVGARSGPKRRLMIEKDLMLPKFIYESNQTSDPISPDSNSGDEDDRVSSYASPPNYPF
ncbi:unnamed protein product [Linum trigynum]|uniref:Uncharacterized protein n=1 Tax=Linum trigynum TaxID=586398 RepID=A0AAV2GMD7_9ROSI